MSPSECRTIRCPRRQGPADVVQLTILLAVELFVAADLANDLVFAERLSAKELNKSSVLQSFEMMGHARGGDLMQPRVLASVRDICAREAGTVVWVDTEGLGYAILALRGGRKQMTDTIDHSVGLEMSVWIGNRLDPGRALLAQYHPSPDRYDEMLRGVIEIGDAAEPLRLIPDSADYLRDRFDDRYLSAQRLAGPGSACSSCSTACMGALFKVHGWCGGAGCRQAAVRRVQCGKRIVRSDHLCRAGRNVQCGGSGSNTSGSDVYIAGW